MKYFSVFILVVITFFYTTPSSAAYPLTVSATDTVITATLSGAKGSASTFELYVSENPTALDGAFKTTITNQSLDSVITRKQVNTEGVVNLSATVYPQKQYFVRVVEIPSLTTTVSSKDPFYTTDKKSVTTKAATITSGALTFTFTESSGTVLVKGTINKSSNPYLARYTSKIQYSKNPIATADASYSVFKTHTTTNNEVGIADDGTYHLVLSNISPSTKYYTRETISFGGTNKVIDGSFNSNSGYTPSTPQTLQEDFENRSYRLLSPLPGFTLFLDPDLCAEQVAQGDKGQVCDINDVLNLGFKILIGAAAVLLVLRIMFEGYKYISSDIPALKVNAKAGIMDAALGLLLALSAFLILNTINPKLVQNSVSVDALSIGVSLTEIDAATFKQLTGETLMSKSEYIPLVEKVAREEGVDACMVKATIQVESEWKAAAIGCDENSKNVGVNSRKAFLQSGIKLDGTKFTPTTTSATINNNCSFDKNKSSSGYGLDWRFSKGGGLMQVTLFPDRYGSDAWYNGVKEGGVYWNKRTVPIAGFETLLKTEENVRRGTKHLKGNLAECGSVEKAFRQYQSGSCSGSSSLVNATVVKKMSVYNSCKAGN